MGRLPIPLRPPPASRADLNLAALRERYAEGRLTVQQLEVAVEAELRAEPYDDYVYDRIGVVGQRG